MAQIAKTGAGKTTGTAKNATDNITELGKRTADQVAKVTRGALEQKEGAARRGVHLVQQAVEAERMVMDRSAEGATAFGRAFVELASQQSRHNLEAVQALAGAVDWNQFVKAVDWQQVFQIQGAYLRASLERTVRLHQHYLQASQGLMPSGASTAQRRAKKAA